MRCVLGKVAVAKRFRAGAAGMVLAGIAPAAVGWVLGGGPAAAVPGVSPVPPVAAEASPGVAEVAPRVAVPGLVPDPNPHPSPGPGRGREVPVRPAVTERPTAAEREALLARVAPMGIRPVVDVTGVPALTVDDELVLSGPPEGVAAMRAGGLDVAAGPRAGVSAVRSGDRIIAWYVADEPTPVVTTSAPPVPPAPGVGEAKEPPPAPADPGLPRTGSRHAVPLGLFGTVLVLGGAAVVRFAGARRRSRP